jgi:hypothetical protein
LQLDLQAKADRCELDKLSMAKCDKRELNAVAEKIGVLQHEMS